MRWWVLVALAGCRYFDSAPPPDAHLPTIDAPVDARPENIYDLCDATTSCQQADCDFNQIACGYRDPDSGVFVCTNICDCITRSGGTAHCY